MELVVHDQIYDEVSTKKWTSHDLVMVIERT